ncbi:MAG TPA: cytidylate kinase [Candidatus Altiarchaeales archaeon]|nr:cytidylate kinase [Candidatus Altiarchaeales archaeon]
MIITIGGSVCSGKTTLARELAKKFNLKHISAGSIMREMAKKRGMSLLEFSRYAESNPEVDLEIDRRQKELATGNCVVDGRLSAHFLDSDLKIWLDAPLNVRVERLSERDKKSEEDAKRSIIEREDSERRRYMEIYGINLGDISTYDLIINTAKFDIKTMTELVSIAIKNI